jgi:TPR repeat protein
MQLGRAYLSGRGVAQDNAEALKLFLYGAERGNPDCEITVSWMYFKAMGAEKDLLAAYMWCTLALNGTEGALNFIETIAKEMTPEQIAEAQKRAEDWKPVS